MQDLFNDKNEGMPAPGMVPGAGNGFNPAEYRYRVEYFTLGGSDTDDDLSALESLLTRSVQSNDVIIMERKDSISGTTGMYTCVVIYMERVPGA
jgi:hypothetical protein